MLNLELERNNRVRVVLTAYEELAEGEKALFRLAAEIGQDRTGQDRTGQDRTGQDRTGATIEPRQRSTNEGNEGTQPL